MQFKVATLLSIIALAYAAPQVGTEIPAVPGDITVGQAGDSCGENLSLSCCNKVDQSGDSVNEASGILSGFLGDAFSGEGLGLFDGCSKLDITAGMLLMTNNHPPWDFKKPVLLTQ